MTMQPNNNQKGGGTRTSTRLGVRRAVVEALVCSIAAPTLVSLGVITYWPGLVLFAPRLFLR